MSDTTTSLSRPLSQVTTEFLYERLRTVLDPETHLNIVDMGLLYDAQLLSDRNGQPLIHIRYTLTTPGCPLAGAFQGLIWNAFRGQINDFDPERQVVLELSFDPPWTMDRLSEEAKAELGL